MEIKLEQIVFQSGTIQITCRTYSVDEFKVRWHSGNFTVLKLNKTYKLEFSKYKTDPVAELSICIDSDLIFNPKSLDICDWQLLRILHPQVQECQWNIFQTLKDLIDNVTNEEVAINLIKNTLEVNLDI